MFRPTALLPRPPRSRRGYGHRSVCPAGPSGTPRRRTTWGPFRRLFVDLADHVLKDPLPQVQPGEHRVRGVEHRPVQILARGPEDVRTDARGRRPAARGPLSRPRCAAPPRPRSGRRPRRTDHVHGRSGRRGTHRPPRTGSAPPGLGQADVVQHRGEEQRLLVVVRPGDESPGRGDRAGVEETPDAVVEEVGGRMLGGEREGCLCGRCPQPAPVRRTPAPRRRLVRHRHQ